MSAFDVLVHQIPSSSPLDHQKPNIFTPFYVAIAICTVLFAALIILNVVCCCCSQYSDYWQDRHTGNRWIVSLWSTTPHKQPPLDFTELEAGYIPVQATRGPQTELLESKQHSPDYLELQERESEI